MSVLDLARPELRSIRPYIPGAYEPSAIRLNANESPWRSPGDSTDRGLNIYPPPRPAALTAKLSAYYGIDQRQILVTRGSSEAIDVLIRGFCTAGRDGIVICPPTFDMYRLYATIQNADITRVPLLSERNFALDVDRILRLARRAHEDRVHLLAEQPDGPVDGSRRRRDDLPRDRRPRARRARRGISRVCCSSATSSTCATATSTSCCSERCRNSCLLRASAAGSCVAAPEIVEFSQGVLPPYTFPTPSIEHVLEALSTDSLRVSGERVALLKRERARLSAALLDVPQVLKVYPSDANFVMVRVTNGRRVP